MSPSLVALRPPPRHALGAWQRRTPCEDHSGLPPRGNRHEFNNSARAYFLADRPLPVTDAGRPGSSGSAPRRRSIPPRTARRRRPRSGNARARPGAKPLLRPIRAGGPWSMVALRRARHRHRPLAPARARPWSGSRSGFGLAPARVRDLVSGIVFLARPTRPGSGSTVEAGSREGAGARAGAIRGARPRPARHPRAKRLPWRALSGSSGRRPPAAWPGRGGRFAATWRTSRRQTPPGCTNRPRRVAGQLGIVADVILPYHRKKCKVAASRRAENRVIEPGHDAGVRAPGRAAQRAPAGPPHRIIIAAVSALRNSRERPARAAQPRESAADSTSGSAGQTSSGGRQFGNFRPVIDFPTIFPATGRISTSPAMRHHAPLSSTGAPQVKR
jgi:hypothetical protein